MNQKPPSPTQNAPLNSTSKNKLFDLIDLKDLVSEYESLEANLQACAAKLVEKDLELKIADERLGVKSNQLKTVENSVDRAKKRLDDIEVYIRNKGVEKKSLLEDVSRVKQSLRTTLADIKKKADSKKFELDVQLKEVEERLRDRLDFFVEQERVRHEGIESLTHQARELEEEVRRLIEHNSYLTKNNADYELILHDLTASIETKTKLLAQLEHREKELSGIRDKEFRVKELERRSQEATHKLILLKQKEESLMTREEALQVRNEDLNLRERRLSGKERLYSL